MTSEKLNSTWSLEFWPENQKYLWGQPSPTPSTGSCHQGRKYCYKLFNRKGTSRWGELDHWIQAKLLKGQNSEWGKGFGAEVTTKVKPYSNSPFLTWGDVVDKILQKLDGIVVVGGEVSNESLFWRKEEWSNSLGENKVEDTPLDQFSSGKNLLLVVMCIITGLMKGKDAGQREFSGRGRLCNMIDSGLEFRYSDWDHWIRNKEKRGEGKEYRCSRSHGTDGCQEAGIALILSVYHSMKSMFPNYGPYKISYWITKEGKDQGRQNSERCQLKGEHIECSGNETSESQEGVIIIEEEELGQLTRPHVLKTSDELVRQNEEQRRITLEEKRDKGGPSLSEACVIGMEKHTTQSKASEHSTETVVIGSLTPDVQNTRHETTVDREAVSAHAATPESTEAEDVAPPLPTEGDTRREDAPDDAASSGGGASQEDGGPQEVVKGSISPDISAWLNLIREPNWGVIGGVAGIVCLALAGGYGLWRVFRDPRRKRRAGGLRAGKNIYGMRYRAGAY
ncbi:hypothetical protein C922_05384 [Plasmodium inui San Antonio 1]|uniref:Uncharacterized protein n=1 Tax=Plasmodium inui San Antonio 1 TaxID=1237626 RepID=W7A559_9APIC|nr:hypothetical protein C922_05384 [Plasmodium inui San Antonio 1]EUD64239.1 hypothetical protein C922_05384 [Plasmodium inui San Antonio 1]